MNRIQRIAAVVATGLGISISTASIIVKDWISDEGWEPTPYRDSGGIWTVCAGHTGPDVIPGVTWTEDECIAVTGTDLVRHGKPVLDVLVDPKTGEIIALIGFAGNAGVAAFLASTALKLQAQGRRVEACQQLLRWVYITVDGRKVDCRTAGRLCPGLPARRERQLERCLSDGNVLSTFVVD